MVLQNVCVHVTHIFFQGVYVFINHLGLSELKRSLLAQYSFKTYVFITLLIIFQGARVQDSMFFLNARVNNSKHACSLLVLCSFRTDLFVTLPMGFLNVRFHYSPYVLSEPTCSYTPSVCSEPTCSLLSISTFRSY